MIKFFLILIFFIMAVALIFTAAKYLAYILLAFILLFLLIKFIKWLIFQIRHYKLSHDLNNLNREINEIQNELNALDANNYEEIPLINFSSDNYSPDGYVPREMKDWKHNFEKCNNIFINSNLPIVRNLNFVTRNINTMILQNPDGSLEKSVNEIFFYEIPIEHQSEFKNLISSLNAILYKHELEYYSINLSTIVFSRSANEYIKYALPLSRIDYDTEKKLFEYIFSNEIITPDEYSNNYQTTESGKLIYTEEGILKKATISKLINNNFATCRFKNYKTGLDLYDIRYAGSIIYKRNTTK